jgi:hypothetical protein
VKFIHASTSKGVIISSLNEKYWNKAISMPKGFYNNLNGEQDICFIKTDKKLVKLFLKISVSSEV